jgi:hypothetical protein
MGIFFVAGLCGKWLLARRVRSGAWPSASLESSRRLVSNPVVKAIPGMMFLFAILYFIASPINGLLSFFLFMCLPLSLTRLATTLKLKETDFTSTELSGSALHPAKPLRSNQWGH